jgi:hypothetical protein
MKKSVPHHENYSPKDEVLSSDNSCVVTEF